MINDLAQKIAGYVNDYLSNFGYEPNCRIGKRGSRLTYRTYLRGTCKKSLKDDDEYDLQLIFEDVLDSNGIEVIYSI